MWVCLYVHSNMCVCVHTSVCICACVFTHLCMCVCVFTHLCVSVCIFTHVYVCMCSHICVYLCPCSHICVYLCVRLFTHLCVRVWAYKPCPLAGLRPVYIGQLAETEPVNAGRVSVAVDRFRGAAVGNLERLAHLLVQLEVGDGAPELRGCNATHNILVCNTEEIHKWNGRLKNIWNTVKYYWTSEIGSCNTCKILEYNMEEIHKPIEDQSHSEKETCYHQFMDKLYHSYTSHGALAEMRIT